MLPRPSPIVARVFALLMALPACAAPTEPASAGAGDRAPTFEAPDLRGETLSLDALRGRPVLLNVWATWCEPCREELPELQRLAQRHGAEGLVVIGVSVDGLKAQDELRRLVAATGVTYPILLDPRSTIVPKLKVVGFPTTVLLDREGLIRWRRDGLIAPDDPELASALRTVLQQ